MRRLVSGPGLCVASALPDEGGAPPPTVGSWDRVRRASTRPCDGAPVRTVQGPWGAIDCERDALGFPSAAVRSLEEAAWMRGYFHARDRLIQIQLTLAIARGSALALLGDNLVARHIDRITRIHRFTSDLDEQVAAVKDESRAQVDAYCAGFNTGARQRGWPLLLRAAGIRPAPYRPQDMVLIYRLISWFGLTQLAETPPLIIGELISSGVDHRALRVLVGDAASAEELARAPVATWPSELALLAGSGLQGSNALAVAGTHSATRAPRRRSTHGDRSHSTRPLRDAHRHRR